MWRGRKGLGEVFQYDTYQPFGESQHSERNPSYAKDLESGQAEKCI